MAKMYEIVNIEEAREYLAHPVLGSRLQEICHAALETDTDDAGMVFGFPDNLKLCSSMTLFEQADPDNPVFAKVLDKYFQGKRDEATLRILKEQAQNA